MFVGLHGARKTHVRCRQTGQNQPLAFLFLLVVAVGAVEVPTAVAVAVVPGVVTAMASALPMLLEKGCATPSASGDV